MKNTQTKVLVIPSVKDKIRTKIFLWKQKARTVGIWIKALVILAVVAWGFNWYYDPFNPVSYEDRQELKRLGAQYIDLNLELTQVTNSEYIYATQKTSLQERLKENQAKQQEIQAQYVGTPQAKAHTREESRVLSGVTYFPEDLWYTFPKDWKDSGLVYYTQTQREHFASNGMLATDLGTSGQALDLYAPDYHGQAITYRYKRLDSHDTLGHTIKLEFPKEDGDKYVLLGHVSEFYLQTGDTVRTGQPIGKVGGCAGSIKESKELEEGASTGCHVHYELWKDGVRMPYPENVGIQHDFKIIDSPQDPISLNLIQAPVIFQNIKLTSYNPARAQTDASPCIGATGVNLCDAVKANPGTQILALSQDLVSKTGKTPFHYGDRVRLNSDLQDSRCNQEAIILDTMNKRFAKRGDLFMMERKDNTSCEVTITKL